MDVSNESGQSQQPKQTEYFSETHNPQRSCRLVEVRVDACLHNEEDVIHRDGGDEIHGEPAPEILHLDLLRVQNDFCAVFFDDPRAEVQHQVNQEERVRDHVKDYPGGGVFIFKEGDAYRDDDQVAHHQQEHDQVPVEPGQQKMDKVFIWNRRVCRTFEIKAIQDYKLQ